MLHARVPSLWITILIALTSACTEEASGPSAPERTHCLTLLQPASGDTVAGMVLCRAEWEGRPAPDWVRFLADGIPIDTATASPWEIQWTPEAPPGGAPLQVEADAWSASGDLIRSNAARVWALPDSAPEVEIVPCPHTVWVHRDQVEELRARARDPEEGRLPGESILWTGTHLIGSIEGERLPLFRLPSVEQTVQARAVDRWGLEGTASLRIRPYRPADRTEPDSCRFNLEAALQALAPELCSDQLAPGFLFVPCRAEAERAGWPLFWTREQFLAALRSWAGEGGVRRPKWEWSPEDPMIWSADGRRQAWQRCRSVRLTFETVTEETGARLHYASASPGTGVGLRFVDWPTGSLRITAAQGEAALWMEEGRDGRWLILEWRDLPYDGALSLAAILAAAAGMPTPGPGAGCLPAPEGVASPP